MRVLARNAVEQAEGRDRVQFAGHGAGRIGRDGEALSVRREHDADHQQQDGADEVDGRALDLARPVRPCKEQPENVVEEREAGKPQRHDDGRTAEREENGQEVEHGRHERVVGANEAEEEPLPGDLHLLGPRLGLHLADVRHPHADRQRERQHEEAAAHVRIAERGEEIGIGPCVGDSRGGADRADKGVVLGLVPHHHELRARGPFHEPEHGQRGGVPHEHLDQKALAVAQQRVPRRQHRDKRGEKPHQDLEMLAEVHAERGERDGRIRRLLVQDRGHLLEFRRRQVRQDRAVVARGAHALVQKRDAEHDDQKEKREEEKRVVPQPPPAALPRLHRVFAEVPLREADQHLEDEREQPGDCRHEQVALRSAADPGQRGQRREDEQCGY